MYRRFLALLAIAGATACHRGSTSPVAGARVATPEPVATAADVIRRASSAFPDAPQAIAFTQVSTVTLSSGTIRQEQRVLVRAPGRMRVDFLPLASRNAAIYRNARAYTFTAGRRAGAQSDRNALLLLGFGLYRQDPEATRVGLEALGIRTALLHEDRWNGRAVWVIGAPKGDLTSNQVWIDSDRWVPLRVIQSERVGDRVRVADTRFSGHAASAPTVPRVIEIYRDGKRALRSTIEDVRTGVEIPAAAFDTTALRAVRL